jgi:hypothetical protein
MILPSKKRSRLWKTNSIKQLIKKTQIGREKEIILFFSLLFFFSTFFLPVYVSSYVKLLFVFFFLMRDSFYIAQKLFGLSFLIN